MIWVVPAVLGVLGVLLFVSGLFAIGRGRIFGGGFGALFGGLLMALGATTGMLGLNLQTYNRLTYEQPVAEVSFVQEAPTAYQATVKLPEGEEKQFDLLGDQWQIDARVLKWKPWANVAGLDANYRLERLSGRYNDINAERVAPRTVHSLVEGDPGIDLFQLAEKHGSWLVDATYGSATYVPMADGATFYVTMSQSGLIARPANDQARAAVQNWR